MSYIPPTNNFGDIPNANTPGSSNNHPSGVNMDGYAQNVQYKTVETGKKAWYKSFGGIGLFFALAIPNFFLLIFAFLIPENINDPGTSLDVFVVALILLYVFSFMFSVGSIIVSIIGIMKEGDRRGLGIQGLVFACLTMPYTFGMTLFLTFISSLFYTA